MISLNPYTGEVLKEFREYSPDVIREKLHLAEKVFQDWKDRTFGERKLLFLRVAALLREKKADLGRLITLEMGKPLRESIAEVEKCAVACEFFAEHAQNFLKEELIKSDASESFVTYEPLGSILAIMPWNFPFWQVFRFAAPALMAGNTGILKHASNVPQCALAIEEIFLQAGFPQGVFQTFLVGNEKVDMLIESPVVRAVTLTGSEGAGMHVASVSGKQIKKTVLELGGSDAFIVLADADIDYAAEMAVKARMINSGQSCIAAKRFIVAESILEEFLAEMKKRTEALIAGDPMQDKTDIGPLARKDLCENLLNQVNASVEKGAVILTGGKISPEHENIFLPSILTHVQPGMPAYEEELFGPVAAVITARDEEDAVRIANDSRFGLGASIWTKDIDKARLLAGQIEAGSVFINGMVKSDPALPFGGIKMSGYGRELSGLGIREFMNVKTIWVK